MLASPIDKILAQIQQDYDLLFHVDIPTNKHMVKKNGRKIMTNWKTGKPFIGKTDELIAAEKGLTEILMLHKRQLRLETITGPVWCIFSFFFAQDAFYTKKGEPNRRLGDQSNLYQLPEDCLSAAGVILDDDQIWSHDLSRRLPDKTTHLEIYIFSYSKPMENLKREAPLRGSKFRKINH